MTIALARESRTFVRGNAPGMHCRYSISATGAAGTPDRATHQQNLYSMLCCMAYSIYRADGCQICFTFFEFIIPGYIYLNIHNVLLYIVQVRCHAIALRPDALCGVTLAALPRYLFTGVRGTSPRRATLDARRKEKTAHSAWTIAYLAHTAIYRQRCIVAQSIAYLQCPPKNAGYARYTYAILRQAEHLIGAQALSASYAYLLILALNCI